MAKRETVMLAHKYDPVKHGVHVFNWFLSEKMDGLRAIYDGGVTRGMKCSNVPFANVDKHSRYQNTIYATGLWSRYLQPIQAPSWFLDQLPPYMLDGELWGGRNQFQKTVSVAKKLVPDDNDWKSIQYKIFDIPTAQEFLADGTVSIQIGNRSVKQIFKGIDTWYFENRDRLGIPARPCVYTFEEIVEYLGNHFADQSKTVSMVPQIRVSDAAHIEDLLGSIVDSGGEGVILRRARTSWKPIRSYDMLKYKPYQDSEGVVVGYTWGRETDKGSKLLGKLGALRINWNGKVFDLSGFTDEERRMAITDISKPGEIVGPENCCIAFPRGSIVTFRYRDLTSDGLPKEARYWRKKII